MTPTHEEENLIVEWDGQRWWLGVLTQAEDDTFTAEFDNGRTRTFGRILPMSTARVKRSSVHQQLASDFENVSASYAADPAPHLLRLLRDRAKPMNSSGLRQAADSLRLPSLTEAEWRKAWAQLRKSPEVSVQGASLTWTGQPKAAAE